jgi:hypothetical protein
MLKPDMSWPVERPAARAPGVRLDEDPDCCAAYVIDPDGYRIEAWCEAPDFRPGPRRTPGRPER